MKWIFHILLFFSLSGKSQQVVELCPNTQHTFTYYSSSSSNGTWYWVKGNDTIRRNTLTITWADTGTFTIKVFFNDGACSTVSNSYSILVKDCGDVNVYFPNSFTPNGDGLNDTWGPISSYIKDVNYRIYNRYGELVFQSNNLKRKWNGQTKSQQSPIGTYILVADWIDVYNKKQELKGFIYLIR